MTDYRPHNIDWFQSDKNKITSLNLLMYNNKCLDRCDHDIDIICLTLIYVITSLRSHACPWYIWSHYWHYDLLNSPILYICSHNIEIACLALIYVITKLRSHVWPWYMWSQNCDHRSWYMCSQHWHNRPGLDICGHNIDITCLILIYVITRLTSQSIPWYMWPSLGSQTLIYVITTLRSQTLIYVITTLRSHTLIYVVTTLTSHTLIYVVTN